MKKVPNDLAKDFIFNLKVAKSYIKIIQTKYQLQLKAMLGLGIALAGLTADVYASDNHQLIAVKSNFPLQLRSATRLASTNPNQKLQLLVWLKGKNQEQLKQLLTQLYTPGSAQYHKFLSPQEYTMQFAPDQTDINMVKQYLLGEGFTVNDIPANGAFIQIQGTVAQAEKVFNVAINNYRYQGRQLFSNDREVSMDASVAGLITHVSGLNNLNRFRPHNLARNEQEKLAPLTSTLNGSYTPQILQKAYGVDKLFKQNLNGSGQVIAIVDAFDDPTIESDLNVFSTRYNLPPCTTANGCFTKLNQYGQSSPLPEIAPPDDDWTVEISLDNQMVHSFVPGAKIILVEVDSDSDMNEYIGVNTIINNQLAKVISNSYGGLEYPNSPAEGIYMQGAVQGISLNFSSGDSADNVNNYTGPLTPEVNYPASSSWVTAIGGSSLVVGSDGRYLNETGWAWPFLRDGHALGSTGGLSQYYTAGAWQSQAISTVNAGGYGLVGTHRAVPDISLLGDPTTGVAIYDSAYGAGWIQEGGTSLACPLFSALIVLANQARTTQNIQQPLGLIAPLLYSMSYNQHQGKAPLTNIIAPHATAVSVLQAAPGWNDITGLGTPYAPLFVQALVNSH